VSKRLDASAQWCRIRMIGTAAVLLLLVACALPSYAHIGPHVLPVHEIPASKLPDLHDGTLADWTGPAATPTLNQWWFIPTGAFTRHDGILDARDLRVNLHVAWSRTTGAIYVGIERIDDIIVRAGEDTSTDDLWSFDGVEVMVDGDHSGGRYACPLEPFASFMSGSALSHGRLLSTPPCTMGALDNSSAQHYFAAVADPGPRLGMGLPTRRVSAHLPPYAEIGGGIRPGPPDTVVTELAIVPYDSLASDDPMRSKPSALAPGAVIGMCFTISEFDREAGSYDMFMSLNGIYHMRADADEFMDFLLIGADDGTAIDARSWGAVKRAGNQLPRGH